MDSVTPKFNQLSSESSSDTDSDSIQSANTEQSDGGKLSVGKCRIPMGRILGKLGLHPRKQQKQSVQEILLDGSNQSSESSKVSLLIFKTKMQSRPHACRS